MLTLRTALFALLMAVAAMASDVDVALADREQYPPSDWWRYYYITTEAATSEVEVTSLDAALRLVIPSMSRQPVLERCTPTQLSQTLYRIDLADLQWDWRAWYDLIARNPYTHLDNDILQRGDWLLSQLTDAHASDAYYRLVFGGQAPKTRDEALKILGVNGQPELRFGLIEGESGVSVQRVRWIENRPAARGYAWGTRDVLKLDQKQDPLEQPEGDFKHDGEEWIVGVRKVHLATGTNGALQVYFLSNGQGGIVARAPVDLVEDSTEFRGVREIRAAGSCIQCHPGGLNTPTRNELREVIRAGVDAYAAYHDQQALEAFHLADIEKEIRRNNEDYAAIVRLACSCEPEAASRAFKTAINIYDEPVTLRQAAHELGAAPDELKLALGLGSASGAQLGARLSSLAHGQTIPRVAWEDAYLDARAMLRAWRLQ